MPTIEVVSLQDAQLELSLAGKRGEIMRQYMDYVEQLETGQAGKLIPGEGEATAAIRRLPRCGRSAVGQEHRREPLGGRGFLLGGWQRRRAAPKRSAKEEQRRNRA